MPANLNCTFCHKFCRRNILETSEKEYLQNCKYNKKTDPFCPIFMLGDVIDEAGSDFKNLAYQVSKTFIYPTYLLTGIG